MSERPLLLSSAKSGVLVSRSTPSPWWRRGAIAFGVMAIVVGAADVASRLSHIWHLASDAAFMAFAPAAALEDPSASRVRSWGTLCGNQQHLLCTRAPAHTFH